MQEEFEDIENEENEEEDEEKQKIKKLVKKYEEILILCGYGIIQKNGVYKVESEKPMDGVPKSKMKKIYDICEQLLDNDLKYLGYLLILQLCQESDMNKLLKSSGYYEKFKKLLKFFMEVKNI